MGAQPSVVTTPTYISGASTGYATGGTTGYTTGGRVIGGTAVGGYRPATTGMVSSYGAGTTYTTGGTYGAAPAAMSAFDRLDRNHDGVITRAEFASMGR